MLVLWKAMLHLYLWHVDNSRSMGSVSYFDNSIVMRVEQQLEHGLCFFIGIYASLAVLRFEQQLDHGLSWFC